MGLGFDKNKNVKLLFKEADKNDKDGDGEQQDENPEYYYCAKILWDGKDVMPVEDNTEQITSSKIKSNIVKGDTNI